MTFALRTIAPANEGALVATRESVAGYRLLEKLPGGLRSDIWLALADGHSTLADAVLLKWFVPHDPGPALENLRGELDLAGKLSHENVARTLAVGFEAGRHFVAKEYLDGTTLQSLLCWATAAGVRIANAAVARVLLALVSAVDHAERLSHSVSARVLSRQLIAEDDVFVTYDGSVKLLGFKTPLGAAGRRRHGAVGATEPAVDALLSEHLSSELGQVLAAAAKTQVRPCDRLKHVGEVVRDWQSKSLGSDGQSELASLMQRFPRTGRGERQARLEAAFEAMERDERSRTSPDVLALDVPPVSGLRRIGSGVRPISQPPPLPGSDSTAADDSAPVLALARTRDSSLTRGLLVAICVAVVVIMYFYSYRVGI